jgi:UDP-N-acetyl-D-glucosamine dehydrogenase
MNAGGQPDSAAARLSALIAQRRCVVGVIGLGYVGLPLAHAFMRAGFRVIGVDTDPGKPAAFASRTPYLKHLGSAFEELCASAKFEATTDHARLGECDVVLVTVPTPLDEHHTPDLSYVIKAGEQIARACDASRARLFVLESTSYPGTTRGEFLAPIAHRLGPGGLGREYFVAFSPEREDPGNAQHATVNIPKLVGGLDEMSGELACALYACAFEKVVPVASAEIAESAKLLENIFRAVNIALVNELKIVLDAMGIDIWPVIEAARTKPFGFMPFYPGPGLGGHCIPIDPFYLTHKAREFGQHSQLIELAGIINTKMPTWVVERVARALSDRGKALRGSRVCVLGLAYKPDVDDVRESPALVIIEQLIERGALVSFSDPHVARTHRMRKHDLKMEGVTLDAASIASFDALVIVTNHRAFDYGLIAQHARLVVDARNAMAAFAGAMGDRLIKA